MAGELATIFASPFFDLVGLKRAALYFDSIKIPSELSYSGVTVSGSRCRFRSIADSHSGASRTAFR